MKLKLEPTGRGFLRADFKDRYGLNCSIQESSLATEACLWLGANQGSHLKGITSQNWTDEELNQMNVNCMARMHLTQEMAGELAKQLAYFARNGKLKTETKKTLYPYAVRFSPNYTNGQVSNNQIYYLPLIKAITPDQAIQKAVKKYADILFKFDIKEYYLSSYCLRKKDLIKYSDSQQWETLLKWLSEGQQGFYTPNGLVKEL